MFHAEPIIGIPDLKVERVDRHCGVDVWARPCSRPYCKYCQAQGRRGKVTDQ